jgi:hypothetical protein
MKQQGKVDHTKISQLAYIICLYKPCNHIITGTELDEVLSPVVKGPDDLNPF